MKTVLALLIVSISGASLAQSNARFKITRAVVASGGATFSTNTAYRLGGTMGQSAADSRFRAAFGSGTRR